MKKNLMATVILLVVGFGGLVVLNHTFPDSMYEGYRFTFNCLAVLALGAVIVSVWIWNQKEQ